MHLFFSGIGGTGIGPLALIAKQAGHQVSGSDAKNSGYISHLRKLGVTDIHIGQSAEKLAAVHAARPVDWLIYSSALNSAANHPELAFCQKHNIKTSKRDELLNEIIQSRKLRLIAIAGTHGKTTTTAMVVWLFKQIKETVSYSVGAKISFGGMGHFQSDSRYFVYECDEFDRNFLAFRPYLSLITGIAHDHHEIFPTAEDYNQAFIDFIGQSERTVLWQRDFKRLGLVVDRSYSVLSEDDPAIEQLKLPGLYNRRDAWLAAQAVHQLTKKPLGELAGHLNFFPGVSRRFEKLRPNLYSDYAHTPEKITAALSVADETARRGGQAVAVVYEPLTNRRMHYQKNLYHSLFSGLKALYWVPSYLAREDPAQKILTPRELIEGLDEPARAIAKPMKLGHELEKAIRSHLKRGDLVLCLSGGGGGSLDEWLRQRF